MVFTVIVPILKQFNFDFLYISLLVDSYVYLISNISVNYLILYSL